MTVLSLEHYLCLDLGFVVDDLFASSFFWAQRFNRSAVFKEWPKHLVADIPVTRSKRSGVSGSSNGLSK